MNDRKNQLYSIQYLTSFFANKKRERLSIWLNALGKGWAGHDETERRGEGGDDQFQILNHPFPMESDWLRKKKEKIRKQMIICTNKKGGFKQYYR